MKRGDRWPKNWPPTPLHLSYAHWHTDGGMGKDFSCSDLSTVYVRTSGGLAVSAWVAGR